MYVFFEDNGVVLCVASDGLLVTLEYCFFLNLKDPSGSFRECPPFDDLQIGSQKTKFQIWRSADVLRADA